MTPTSATSTYTVAFGATPAPTPALAPTARVPRVARLLALAHRINAMIEAGELRDLAHAAKVCGLTRARVTQLCNLSLLAPAIQEEILAIEDRTGRDIVTERGLRALVAEPDWATQLRMWQKLKPPMETP